MKTVAIVLICLLVVVFVILPALARILKARRERTVYVLRSKMLSAVKERRQNWYDFGKLSDAQKIVIEEMYPKEVKKIIDEGTEAEIFYNIMRSKEALAEYLKP